MQRMEQFIKIRRTEHTDARGIKKLIDQNILNAFGKITVLKILERSVLSLTLTKEENLVVGCACFSNAPSRRFTVPESWKDWFDSNIGPQNVDSINSLFIELLVVDPFYAEHLVNEICKTVFTMLIDVQNIFLLTNSKADFKPASSNPFQKLSSKSATTDFSVSVAYRHDVFPILFSRTAAVEDNDDLVPLFNSQTDLLRKTYGNYYIAELVEAQNEGLKCVVIECDRKAVGFLSATKRINLEKLNECYDLILFNGLRKPHPKDNLSPSEKSREQENSLHIQGEYVVDDF
ncbi:hypothetical protein PHET_10601 [Paragonimus heterotremus]|uniref:Cilia- and flagella-associated protein 61 N-terminal domain-containing protein n=1 Tax=Paragonimus heterotremus TaxID=100268 RepID=A0A8J4T233_9TREM|nr:hypothetical protein PHET_10601 [Paragonimus heterotremus]